MLMRGLNDTKFLGLWRGGSTGKLKVLADKLLGALDEDLQTLLERGEFVEVTFIRH